MPEKYPVSQPAQPGDEAVPASASEQGQPTGTQTMPLLDAAAQQALVKKLKQKYGL